MCSEKNTTFVFSKERLGTVCGFYFAEYAICNVVYSLLDIRGISVVSFTLVFRRLCSHCTYNYSNHLYCENITTMLYKIMESRYFYLDVKPCG